MKGRGVRLAQDRRKKAKAAKILKERIFPWEPKYDPSPRVVGRMAATPRSCSCAMCGNPRKHFKGKDKLTIQERREREKLRR